MSIDFLNKPNNAGLSNSGDSNRTTQVTQTATPTHVAEKGNRQNDTVSVTHDARLLHRAAALAADVPAFDTQRVQSLRVEVAKGTWAFDSTRVAEKFMRFEQALRS